MTPTQLVVAAAILRTDHPSPSVEMSVGDFAVASAINALADALDDIATIEARKS